MKRRVVVTGLGIVAPNGIGKDAFWEACLEGRSGVDLISAFDTTDFRTKVAAEITDFQPTDFMPLKVSRMVDRFVHFGLAAAEMALRDGALDISRIDPERTGVIVGSGLGGILFHEEQIREGSRKGTHASRINPICVPKITPNAVAAHIAIQYGFLGPNYVISTACASGNHAIGEAFHKIQADKADVIITGGTEAPLTDYTFGAFYSLRILSRTDRPPHEVSRPFDRERNGFVIGEGAAVLILEVLDHALERGAHIYAEIIGYGLASGAHHMVMPVSDGKDAARTMRLALDDAGVGTEDIDYINAHGTSTYANDLAETKAIKSVFGKRAYQIPVSSIKSMIGHTIGAAGAIEAVAACLTVENHIIPPTINYKNIDPECDLDYTANFARTANIETVLSNSFGFGSVNSCIVLRKYT